MILMVQFVAFFGALGFNQVARVAGAKHAIMAVAGGLDGGAGGHLRLGADRGPVLRRRGRGGLVMGGSQALSRSLYSQMIPKGKEAEYFGLYEISDKGTSWLCPLLFGLALQFTRSYRLAILSLVVFFVAGLALLARVDVARAARDAERR